MNWWKALKAAWVIAQMIKPVKHNEKVDEIVVAVEQAVKDLKKEEKE